MTSLPAPLAALPSTHDTATSFQRWIVASGLNKSVGAYRDGKLPRGMNPDGTMAATGAHPAAMAGGGAMAPAATMAGAATPNSAPSAEDFAATHVLKVGDPSFSVEKSFVAWFGPGYVQAVQARMAVATTTEPLPSVKG